MALLYEGITIPGTGAPVALSAAALWTVDASITVTAAATLTGANGVLMASLTPGHPFQIPRTSDRSDGPNINLAQISVTIAAGQTACVSYGAPYSFYPNQLEGLRIWVAADRITGLVDNDPIATAPDLSGLGNNFTQGVAGDRPLFKVNIVNGKPVMRFDGATDFLSSPYAASDATDTEQFFFAVFRTTAAVTQQCILWAGDAVANGFGMESEIHMGVGDFVTGGSVVHAHMGKLIAIPGSLLPFSDTASFHTMGARWTKLTTVPTAQLFLDGAVGPVVIDSAAETFGTWSGVTHMGKPGGAARWFGGDIAEAAVYNAATWGDQTLANYNKLAAYARAKYALS